MLDFNIHNLLRVVIHFEKPQDVKYLVARLAHFRDASSMSPLDIEVWADAPQGSCKQRKSRAPGYHVERNHVCWFSRYKFAEGWVGIEGLENETLVVRFSGNRFWSKYLPIHILEPAIHYKLAFRGAMLLHASAIGDGRAGYVFTGASGTGKTSLMLSLLETGASEFLGDDFVIVSEEGHVYSYPTPAAIFYDHLKSNSFLVHALSAEQRKALLLRKWARVLSRGWAKFPRFIEIRTLFPQVATPDRRSLATLALLSAKPLSQFVIRRITSKTVVEDRVMDILRREFRFFMPALEAYNAAFPSSQVGSHEQRSRVVLRAVLDKVVASEIQFPKGFRVRWREFLRFHG